MARAKSKSDPPKPRRFYVWDGQSAEGHGIIGPFLDLDDRFGIRPECHRNKRVKATTPVKASYKRYSRDAQRFKADCFNGWSGHRVIVSPPLRHFLEEHAPGQAQFIPVIILDESNENPPIEEYCIVHALQYFDMTAVAPRVFTSEELRNKLMLGYLQQRVIDPEGIPEGVHICWVHTLEGPELIISGEMGDRLRKQGFTNVHLWKTRLTTDEERKKKPEKVK